MCKENMTPWKKQSKYMVYTTNKKQSLKKTLLILIMKDWNKQLVI